MAGSNCDGAGYFKTTAGAGFGGGSSSNANVTFVDSQSLSVPNTGQTYTQLSFSATYFVEAFVFAQGVGFIGAYDGRTTVQAELSLVENGVLLDNSTIADKSWSNSCSTGGVSGSSSAVIACPPSGIYTTVKSQYTATGGYRLYPGNSYALRLSFLSSSSAWAMGDASVGTTGCFVYDLGQGINSDCTNTKTLTPTTQCPAGTYTNPCHYVQWQYATYTFSDVSPSPPDFSITQSVITTNPTGINNTSNCGTWGRDPQNAFVPDNQYAVINGTTGCVIWGASVDYIGYSSPLPAKAIINRVSLLVLHYEGPPSLNVPWINVYYKYSGGTHLFYSPPASRRTPTLDSVDITSLRSSWSQSDLSSIIVRYYMNQDASYLDWLPLKIEYTLPPVYQSGPSWWDPVSIASINGFSGPVNLSASITTTGNPSPPSFSIDQSTVTLPNLPVANGLPASSIVNLSMSATNSTTPGSYTVTITASSGGIMHTIYVTILVARVDPTVVMTLSKSTVYYGVNNLITVNLAESNTGNIAVSSQTVYVLVNGSQIRSWSPPISPLSPGQAVTGSISWNVTSLSVGTYNVTAYTPLLLHENIATNRMMTRFDVNRCCSAGFTVSAPTSTVYVARGGGSVRVQITLSPTFGFHGGVAANGTMLSAGLFWDFTPSFFPGSNGHARVYVNGTVTNTYVGINATNTATLGSYNLNIVVSNDLPQSSTIAINVVIVPPNFSISTSPTSIILPAQGAETWSTTTIQSLNGTSAMVNLTSSISPGVSSGQTQSRAEWNTWYSGVTQTSVVLSSGQASTLNLYLTSGSQTGNYTVTVTGAIGSISHTTTLRITIVPSIVAASITYSPSSPHTGQAVTFTGSVQGGTSPFSYSWNFGDGTSGSGNPASHVYSALGTYCPTLTVTDSNGVNKKTNLCLTVTPQPPDFSISANPSSLSIPQAGSGTSTITVASLGGLSGTVTLSAVESPQTYNFVACFHGSTCSGVTDSITVTMTPSAPASVTLTIVMGLCSAPPGSYAVAVNGTSSSPQIFHSITIPITVPSPNTCDGGGASLAFGTLITMRDGSQVPVQNLRVGDTMLGYDVTTGRYTSSTVASIRVVHTSNMLVINTATGTPLRVDASPTEILWTRLTNGTALWLPVTQLTPGDSLFTQNGWVQVTSIQSAPAGTHNMYDVTATFAYFADGYLDPPMPS